MLFLLYFLLCITQMEAHGRNDKAHIILLQSLRGIVAVPCRYRLAVKIPSKLQVSYNTRPSFCLSNAGKIICLYRLVSISLF